MRIKNITIENIGIIEDMSIDVNKPLMLFYGDIRQGKTTILNSVQLCAGGTIPNGILKDGAKEGFIELEVTNGRIRREFYLSKENTLKPRAIDAIIDNHKLSQKEVTALFNPFLLDQDFFKKKNSGDKAKFLLEIFGVDTSFLDSQKKDKEQKAKEIRAAIKAFGEIDTTEVPKSNIEELRGFEKECRERLNKKYQENGAKNKKAQLDYDEKLEIYKEEVRKWESLQVSRKHALDKAENILQELAVLGYKPSEGCPVRQFVFDLPTCEIDHHIPQPVKPTLPDPMPDQTELIQIQEKISEQGAQEVLYNNYLERLEKQEQKDVKKKALSMLTEEIKSINAEKAELLQTISGSISGLEFNESGDFTYLNEETGQKTTSDRLSDSQQMELSNKLSSLYPDGLQIALIDRGESMGKSVFGLVDEAKENDRNILVTIVGDKPAEVPEDIGVFVVQNGGLK